MASLLEFVYQTQSDEIDEEEARNTNQKVTEFLIKIAIQKAFSK